MTLSENSGLTQNEIDLIIREIRKVPSIEEVLLFGSRAKGRFKRGSDVDLAVRGSHLQRTGLVALSYALNQESLLPYHFDIINLDDADIAVQEHIKRIGITFYRK